MKLPFIGSCLSLAFVSTILLASCGSSGITLNGTVELDNGGGLDGTNFSAGADGCSGTDGYSDLTDGASVTVYDSAGTVIAVGSLDAGRQVGEACLFPWSVSHVKKSSFYKVEVSHRGQLTYSYAQAKAGGLDSSIGSS